MIITEFNDVQKHLSARQAFEHLHLLDKQRVRIIDILNHNRKCLTTAKNDNSKLINIQTCFCFGYLFCKNIIII